MVANDFLMAVPLFYLKGVSLSSSVRVPSSRLLKQSVLYLSVLLSLTTVSSAHSENLREVITRTLTQSPQVLSNVSNTNSVGLAFAGAKTGYYPNLDLSANTGPNQYQNTNTQSSNLNVSSYRLVATQPLFDGFSTMADVERQKAKLIGAEARLSDSKNLVAMDVTQAYFGVLRADDLYFLANENVKAHRSYVLKVNELLRADPGRRYELAQAESRLAQASASLALLQGRARQARVDYQRVTGTSVRDLQVEGSLSVPANLAAALSEAREKNPALTAAEAELRAAKESLSIANAPNLPKVYLEATISKDTNVSGSATTTDNKSLYLMARWNLYRGGGDSLQKKIAAEGVEATRQAQIDAALELDKRISTAWYDLQAQKAVLKESSVQTKFSIEIRDSSDAQFRLGKKSLLDVLNAELELFSSKSAEIAARYDVLLAGYRLNATMGKLLQRLDVKG